MHYTLQVPITCLNNTIINWSSHPYIGSSLVLFARRFTLGDRATILSIEKFALTAFFIFKLHKPLSPSRDEDASVCH